MTKQLSNVIEYKISILLSTAFSYTDNNQYWNIIDEKTPFENET